MATGSILYIGKKVSEITPRFKELIAIAESKAADAYSFGIAKEREDYTFIDVYDDGKHYVADVKKDIIYYVTLEYDFISNFNSVAESLGLRRYSLARGIRKITAQEAVELARALRYILDGKYEQHVERLLNNPHIQVFGELSVAYSHYRHPQLYPRPSLFKRIKEWLGLQELEDFEEADNYFNDIDGLQRFLAGLDAYIYASDNDDENLALFYTVWG